MSNGIKRFKSFVNALYGQTHDIEIATVKGRNTDMANPFLNAIGTRFIEGAIVAYIVIYFVVCERLECHVGDHRETRLAIYRGQRDTSDYLMRPSAQLAKHGMRLGSVMRLAHNMSAQHDNGVSRNVQLVRSYRQAIRCRLLLRYVLCYARSGQIVGITLINTINDPNVERNVET